MTVKSSFSIQNPKTIEMTMSVTMTLKEWVSLKSHITEEADYWSTTNAFCRSIKALVEQAEKEFTAYEYDPEPTE